MIYVEPNQTNFDSSQRVHNDRILAIPVEARREAEVREAAAAQVFTPRA